MIISVEALADDFEELQFVENFGQDGIAIKNLIQIALAIDYCCTKSSFR